MGREYALREISRDIELNRGKKSNHPGEEKKKRQKTGMAVKKGKARRCLGGDAKEQTLPKKGEGAGTSP